MFLHHFNDIKMYKMFWLVGFYIFIKVVRKILIKRNIRKERKSFVKLCLPRSHHINKFHQAEWMKRNLCWTHKVYFGFYHFFRTSPSLRIHILGILSWFSIWRFVGSFSSLKNSYNECTTFSIQQRNFLEKPLVSLFQKFL